MLRAVLSKYILAFPYNLVLLERLRASPKFREVCGFTGDAPSESTYSRFTTRLAQHQGLIDDCLAGVTNPESTDGRRKDSVRGVKELQTRWSGLEFG